MKPIKYTTWEASVLYTAKVPHKVHGLGASVLYRAKVPHKVHDLARYILVL